MLRRYTVGALTTGCRRLAMEWAERGGHDTITLREWPRPDWYETPSCDCGCNSGEDSESKTNKQLTLF